MCAILVAAPTFGAQAAESGSIYATTLPSGADVFLDGTYVGRSPVLMSGLDPGRHSLTLTKAGWVVREVDVGVAGGSLSLSSTRLAPGPHAYAGDAAGKVVLRGMPPGSAFLLDGIAASVAAGQPMSMPAGRHQLTVVTPRGRTTRPIDVWPDTTTNVVLTGGHAEQDPHSAIVAPAEDYLPTDDFSLNGKTVVVHYGGHTVICRLGNTVVTFDGAARVYDAAGEVIGGKLYLPLPLLETLSGDTSK